MIDFININSLCHSNMNFSLHINKMGLKDTKSWKQLVYTPGKNHTKNLYGNMQRKAFIDQLLIFFQLHS